jgi:predicted membrane protein
MLLLFTTPVPLTGWQQLFLLLPLCLSVSIVYKLTKLEDLREVPVASVITWATIVAGMFGVGFGLYALHWLLA